MASDGSKTMSFLNEDVLFHGLSMTIDLIPRVCVAVIAAYVSMRVKVLRQALNNKQLHWRHQIVAAVFFGLLAIIGTHSGIKVDIHQAEALVDRSLGVFFVLQPSQAIIGFRDLMVFTAGLFGGVWIGLGAGLLAGLERYSIVGDFRIAGLGTIILGLGAGLSRQFWPRWTTSVTGILSVSLVGTLLLASMLFVFIHPHDYAIAIVREMIISESLVNSLGCLLFMVVMKDLESDQLKIEAQQAELRALQAQIEPHFLNNTFNAIQALISIDPHIASEYVVKLARFMDQTRQNAGVNAITLAQELAQLRFYLDFQRAYWILL
ncbi:membrane hypothetical protein [Crenothrix polyspora]|uniref:Uncharacterized protein n=2 Tax=Crenothrix polyspora TaxID=360316 RepID=A0A1R4H4M2_9GAMM|nr:membrane hypothetical protein [Crenothrix polyspora]